MHHTIRKCLSFCSLAVALSLSYSQIFALPPASVPVVSHAEANSAATIPAVDLQRFSSALQAVREVYVEKIPDDKLFDYAISGLLSNLDPHSDYLNQDAYQALQDMTNGSFGGIGIEVTQQQGMIRVITPIDDTPAFNAGIKPGDLIVRINGDSVLGMSVEEAIKAMRGDAGSTVTLVILRKDESKPLTFTVKRAIIKIDSVKQKVIDSDYGYIRISDFEEKTGQMVADAIKQLQKETNNQLKGIIIDLRDNPGGLLDASVDTANDFLDKDKVGYGKKVVYTQGRISQMDYTGYVTGHDLTNGTPIIVLINEGTASAAEIVAAALQDQHRAIIVGTRSFGKGSVQTVLPLPPDEKTAIKLTTALYYTPSGRSIQAEGVIPDVQVAELAIPKSVQPDVPYLGSEADLSGHLPSPILLNTKTNTTDDNVLLKQVFADKKANPSLLYQDYQLYEGLNVLKALSISQNIQKQ